MTNYNDGKWHGHNGGERPVHPETVVQITYTTGMDGIHVESKFVDWDDGVIAFRVIKEYKEPREFWISKNSTKIWTDKNQAEADARLYGVTLIHVREVLE